MKGGIKKTLKMLATRHRPNGERNIFIHSLPRSGSTWLMELILTQPGFTSYNEPLNLDKEVVRDHLGLAEWRDVHSLANRDQLHQYFEKLCAGSMRDPRFNRPAPFSQFYRPVTWRAVFKIIHAGQEHISWMSKTFNGHAVLLLRHPVPVALSRRRLPKLDAMLDSDLRECFSDAQREFASRIMEGDDSFAKRILDWSLQNAVALNTPAEECLVLTYEQLVLDPVPLLNRLAERLQLPRPDRMMRRLAVASRSTELSDSGTKEVLSGARDVEQKQWLVEKWKANVSFNQLETAEKIMDVFGLSSVYTVGSGRPKPSFWLV